MTPATAVNFTVEYSPDIAEGSTIVTPDGHIWTYNVDFGTWDTTIYEYDENYDLVNSSYESAEVLLPLFAVDDLIFEGWYSAGAMKIFNTTSGLRTAEISAGGAYFLEYRPLGNDIWFALAPPSNYGSIFHINGTVYDTITFPDPIKWTLTKDDMLWAVTEITSPMGFKIFDYNISANTFSYVTQRIMNYTIGNGDVSESVRQYNGAGAIKPVIFEEYAVMYGDGNQTGYSTIGVYDVSTNVFVSEINIPSGKPWGTMHNAGLYNEQDQKLYATFMGDAVGPIFVVVDTTDGSIDDYQSSTPYGTSTDNYEIQPKYSMTLLPVDTGKDVISFILNTQSVNELEDLASDSYYGWVYGRVNVNYVLVQYNGTSFKYETLFQENHIDYVYPNLLQLSGTSLGNKVLLYKLQRDIVTGEELGENYLVFTFPEGDQFEASTYGGGILNTQLVNTTLSGILDVTGEFKEGFPTLRDFSHQFVGDCQGTPSNLNFTVVNQEYSHIETSWTVLEHSVDCLDAVVWYDGDHYNYENATEGETNVSRFSSSYGSNIATTRNWFTPLFCVENRGCYVYAIEGFTQTCYAQASYISPFDVNGVSPPIDTNIYAEVIDPITNCSINDYVLSVLVNSEVVGNLSETVSYIQSGLEVGEQLVTLEILEVPSEYISSVNANATINVTEGYQPTYVPSDFTPIVVDALGGVGAEFATEGNILALGGALLLVVLSSIFVGIRFFGK